MSTAENKIEIGIAVENPLRLPPLSENPSTYEIGALEWQARKLEKSVVSSLSLMGRLLWTEGNALHTAPEVPVGREELADFCNLMAQTLDAALDARERAGCAHDETGR